MSIKSSKSHIELKGRSLRQQVAQLKANRKQINQELEINRLQIRTEQLNLTLTALCRYLTEKGIVDESKLNTIIKELDKKDKPTPKKRPSLLTPDPHESNP